MNESFLSVVETRRFLGREFLTWLVERLEEHGGRIEIDSDAVDLALGDRVVLEAGGDPGARLTLVDEGDLRPELGVGLRRGKLLDRARISISSRTPSSFRSSSLSSEVAPGQGAAKAASGATPWPPSTASLASLAIISAVILFKALC